MPLKTVILGWSGADWLLAQPLLDQSLLPALSGFLRSGASGAIRGFAPFDSTLSWQTLATGTHPDDHLLKPDPFWILGQAQGERSGVVGWPGQPAIHPPELTAAIEAVQVRPADLDPKLLGLFLPAGRSPQAFSAAHGEWLGQRLAEVYSVHNASMVLAQSGSLSVLAVAHRWLREITDRFPARPSEAASETVIGAYRLMDALLADLLRACASAEFFALVADHGSLLATDSNGRARRPDGIVCVRGAGFSPGSTLANAKLADLAPTIRATWGAPIGFTRGRPWQHGTDLPAPSPGTAPSSAIDPLQVSDSTAYVVGLALSELGRRADAVAWLHRSLLANPESAIIAQTLAQCLIDLGCVPEAERIAGPVFDGGDNHPACRMLRAKICVERQQGAEALALLEPIAPEQRAAEVQALRRHALLQAGHFAAAETEFLAALPTDAHEPLLWVGLGYARLWLGQPAAADAAARRAEALDPLSAAVGALRKDLQNARAARASASAPLPLPAWSTLTRSALARTALRRGLREREQAAQTARAAVRAVASPLRYVLKDPVTLLPDEPTIVITGSTDVARSLLARGLVRCGLPLLTDGVRRRDDASPAGYLEWEPVKALVTQPRLLERAQGKAVIVAPDLLRHVAPSSRLHVIELAESDDIDSVVPAHFPNLRVVLPRLQGETPTVLAEISAFLGPTKLPRPERFPSFSRS